MAAITDSQVHFLWLTSCQESTDLLLKKYWKFRRYSLTTCQNLPNSPFTKSPSMFYRNADEAEEEISLAVISVLKKQLIVVQLKSQQRRGDTGFGLQDKMACGLSEPCELWASVSL